MARRYSSLRIVSGIRAIENENLPPPTPLPKLVKPRLEQQAESHALHGASDWLALA
jgi:hypothetical protein